MTHPAMIQSADDLLERDVRSLLTIEGVTIVPVIHFRQEWARLVRGAFKFHSPAVVAVEFPPSLTHALDSAVKRLPCLSMAILEYPEGQVRFFPVEPTDPMVEAIRLANENKIPWKAVDTETPVYPEMDEAIPDPYAAFVIGHGEFHSSCLDPKYTPFSRIPADSDRELTMAFHCRRLSAEHGKVLLVCGLAHAQGVARAMEEGAEAIPIPTGGIPEVILATPHPDTIREIFVEPAVVMAAWEIARRGDDVPNILEPETTEADEAEIISQWVHGQADELPDDMDPEDFEFNEDHADSTIETGDAETPARVPQVLRLIKSNPGDKIPDASMDPLSLLLESLLLENFDGFFDADDFHTETGREPKPPFPFKKLASYLASECGMTNLDRIKVLFRIIRQAAEILKAEQGEHVTPLHLSNLVKFSRNYAFIEGLLVPDIWHLAVGCRGVSGDDLAWHFWKLATTYPWHDAGGSLPIAYIRGEDLWSRGRRFNLERKIHGRNSTRRGMGPMKPRPQEKRPGDWDRNFNSFTMCSYPPEDILIEGWGEYLQKKCRQTLSAETASVREFTTSILDGVDVRETVRNWHHGKIFVRENGRTRGDIGTVIVIFDNDGDDSEFPWKVTWHGEHEQESDMAFYATRPGADLAGPGIARCRYGGFMLSYPPGRLYDIWRDPAFLLAGREGKLSKPDHLLLAALDYSLEKYVAYVGSKPPSPKLVSLGRKMDRRIVYIPLGTFSPVTLRKMRVFHVLAGKETRDIAKDYIFN